MQILRANPRRWLLPCVAVFAAAAGYASLGPRTWQASQALAVRHEAVNKPDGPGKFRDSGEMKTTQETVLELARNHTVLKEALSQVGPSSRNDHPGFPTAEDAAELRQAVKVIPPKGSEFGKTEIFYLQVRDRDPERATALTDALCDRMQEHFRRLRSERAESLIKELSSAAQLAENDRSEATARLSAVENTAGGDLAELRSLHDSKSGESDLRRKQVEIQNELRQAVIARKNTEELQRLLTAAVKDQEYLTAAPNSLLESQPTLRRLKEGLIDAQLRTAGLLGTMEETHPLAQAAKESEQVIRNQVREELTVALKGIEVDLRLVDGRVQTLEEQQADCRVRIDRLSGLRAEYSNLAADVGQYTTRLEEARRDLAEAEADLAGAAVTNLIHRIDVPDIGDRPVSPGPTLIMSAGLLGGLIVGVGIALLLHDPNAVVAEEGKETLSTDQVGPSPARPRRVGIYRPASELIAAIRCLLGRSEGLSSQAKA